MRLTRRVLHQSTKSVNFQYGFQTRGLAQQLLTFMRVNHGIGLAANQVGIAKRVFVMDINGWQRCCFNPVIKSSSPEQLDFAERCLSFPGEHCTLGRPSWINVWYQDSNGYEYQERLDGLAARCFQHELDHLDGITMWDRHKAQNAKQP